MMSNALYVTSVIATYWVVSISMVRFLFLLNTFTHCALHVGILEQDVAV